jgi:hypothetical protein
VEDLIRTNNVSVEQEAAMARLGGGGGARAMLSRGRARDNV